MFILQLFLVAYVVIGSLCVTFAVIGMIVSQEGVILEVGDKQVRGFKKQIYLLVLLFILFIGWPVVVVKALS